MPNMGRHGGVQRTIRSVEVEEGVLDSVAEDPTISVRNVARQFQISKCTVNNILKEQLLHPYHMQKVQGLSIDDYPVRIQFCTWLLEKVNQTHDFTTSILFSDEAGFRRDGPINLHNLHIYADENPHGIRQTRHQVQFQINLWAGIIGHHLIGPVELPPRLNGQRYLQFLQEQLPNLLEDLPLQTRINMWFMHDGAPPHFSLIVREHLNTVYPDRWIGRSGPVSWPRRSPDLNPLDFYFWGDLKRRVYATPMASEDELRQRIFHHSQEIKNNIQMIWRVQPSLVRRARECIRQGGAHFEQFL